MHMKYNQQPGYSIIHQHGLVQLTASHVHINLVTYTPNVDDVQWCVIQTAESRFVSSQHSL